MRNYLWLLLALSSAASGKATLTQKDYYIVTCKDVVQGQHTTLHKALETAVNHAPCSIAQPTVTVVTDVDVQSPGADVKLTWQAPTTRTDGKLLKLEDIRYYILTARQGDVQRVFEAVDPSATVTRTVYLPPGTWQFSVVAVDVAGLQSPSSNVTSTVIPLKP